MAAKIVLFGATGYTGQMTARSLVAKGAVPVLAARSKDRLDELASELGGLPTAVADVTDPASVSALVEKGDALITTIGPFVKYGEPALSGAIAKGANYVDSTGEPAWIRRVFEADGRAQSADVSLITAFGYDYVPGNLAAGIALARSDSQAVRVDVGYFFTGKSKPSGGTAASLAGALLEPGFEWSDGRLVTKRGAANARSFETSNGVLSGISIGASENITLPRVHSELKAVRTYLGWVGPRTKPVQIFSAGLSAAVKVPGVKPGLTALMGRVLPGSTGGPSDDERARSGSLVVAETFDAADRLISRVELSGPNGYDLTADFLAEAGIALAHNTPPTRGAIGPLELMGLEGLTEACARAGLSES
jgi:short subunit dehydrogenase-like uncharacterized protein